MDKILSAQGWNGTPDAGRSALGTHDDAMLPGRDLVEVARYLVPMEARLAQGCLVAAGIPAVLADEQLLQANMLLAPAVGGVRILVPQEHLQESVSVLEALKRGDFALDEDTDVGSEDQERLSGTSTGNSAHE
ncbi:hypothetical protein GCM10027321_34620 [Massilia terrae]|uniref:DUF2007 domain-containing protein n=1 Tax=Massilia terrae TaxID=1811224 RepID=A0ABT2D344_9BURK|nr:DUF2007 domain-containing protein [Massilia terrae]MCS0660671.1 DUF2007 domain-containing protein [Massilia terrae]